MTLAMHGKSRRRRGLLVLAAFFAVLGAMITGATMNPAGQAAAQTELNSSYLTVCKTYLPTGAIDDFDRGFPFLLDRYAGPNGTQFIDGVDILLTLDEGETKCTEPIAIPTGGYVTVSEPELPGWYQATQFTLNGAVGPAMAGPYYYFNTETTCLDASCVVTFANGETAPEADDDPGIELNSVFVCKAYLETGPIDDFGRTFTFTLDVDQYPFGNADYFVDFTITLDEGQTACAEVFEVPADAHIGVYEVGSAGFQHAPGYPQFELVQGGQQAMYGEGMSAYFENDNDCPAGTPCVVTFFNKSSEGGDVGYAIRVCKTFLDNQDGYNRPFTTFGFDANGVPFSLSVGEDGTDCTIVMVPLSDPGDPITVSEHTPANWDNAPGFPKRKIDSYPLQSDGGMGQNAWAITFKNDDGCYEPYAPIEGGEFSAHSQSQVIRLPDAFVCTVYFFNQEQPGGPPECEANCDEPQCEASCNEPECELDCGTPSCDVACDPPVCVENCGDPVCELDCEPETCQSTCDETTPAPEATPDTPSTPEPQTTPAPEEEIEGETTPGPQATPKAPDTGSSVTTTAANGGMHLVVGMVLLMATVLIGAAALPKRR